MMTDDSRTIPVALGCSRIDCDIVEKSKSHVQVVGLLCDDDLSCESEHREPRIRVSSPSLSTSILPYQYRFLRGAKWLRPRERFMSSPCDPRLPLFYSLCVTCTLFSDIRVYTCPLVIKQLHDPTPASGLLTTSLE